MTLRQTIQAASGNTSDLITKLSATSNQAVKTREGLFAQLSDELSRYIEIEEQHFLPLLRKHSETKGLAADALKGNKELRASLEKLSGMPQDNDEFLAALSILEKSFQQHVRNERKELLPAVLKAFSDEEAGEMAAGIDSAVADSVKAKQDEKREEAAEVKRQAEEEEAAAAAQRATARAQRAADRDARETSAKAVETLTRSAAAATDSVRQAAATITERTHRLAADAQEAMTTYNRSSQTIRDDLQAVGASSTVSAGAVSEIYSAWMKWWGATARMNAEASQNLMQCRTVQQVAGIQQDFAANVVRNWMEGNAKVLEITQRTSKHALGPLNGRLSDAA